MLNIGKVGRNMTLTGSLLLSLVGCGDSAAARIAEQKAARAADEIRLSQEADKLIRSCQAESNSGTTEGIDSLSRCVEEGAKKKYPDNCQYYDNTRWHSLMGAEAPSKCDMRFQSLVMKGKEELIDKANIPPEETADIARFKRAAVETYESCDNGHLNTASGKEAFKECVVNRHQFKFPGCTFIPNQIVDCKRLFSREVIAGVEPYIQNAQEIK